MDVSLRLVKIMDEKVQKHAGNQSAEMLSYVSVLHGEIDQKRMLVCLRQLFNNYPALKTRSAFLGEWPLDFKSMNFQSSGHFKNFIAEYAEAQRKALAKKCAGPFFGCSIIKYDFQAYLFFLTIDPAIYDGYPSQLFFDELLKYYAEMEEPSSHEDDEKIVA